MAGTYEFADDMCSDLGGSALCIDRPVTIEAEVAGSVVLDAKGARRVIYVAAAGWAELVGLNITGGYAYKVRFLTSIKPKHDVRIISFCVSRQGGGICIDGTATLTDTNVYENQAGVGGGLAIYGTATLTNTNVYSNTARSVRARLLNLPRRFLHRPDGTLRARLYLLAGWGALHLWHSNADQHQRVF